MRKAEIESQNRLQISRQTEFRVAADVVAKAWRKFAEVEAVAVIGSVARALWKEVPRFREFRRARIEVWHECHDLDMALWLNSQHRLGELRRAASNALARAREERTHFGVSDFQLDMFLFEPGTDAYLGRLCGYSTCPKGKVDCWVPGCGTIAFNKVIPGFEPYRDLLATADESLLYRKGYGVIRSALTLPTVD